MDLENIKSFKSVKLFSKNWGAGVVFLGFFLANEIQKKKPIQKIKKQTNIKSPHSFEE